VIGNGVVLDPIAFLKEVAKLRDLGVDVDGQLFVSNRAQVILPYHRMIELAAESAPGRQKIGTTSRGIGPAYEDKMARSGLRVVDLLNPKILKAHIENACQEKNAIAHALFGSEPIDPAKMFDEYAAAAEQVRPFVTDTGNLLNKIIAEGGSVMFEGAQGTMLDIDHGTYPVRHLFFRHGGRRGHGYRRRPDRHRHRVGVTKAYVTRVGEGPFPYRNSRRLGGSSARPRQRVRRGHRAPRRCGWLDIPLLRYSNQVNGTEWLVVTKMDVLDELAEIPVCIGYEIDGKFTDTVPADVQGLESIVPRYTTLPGWRQSTEGIQEFDSFPRRAGLSALPGARERRQNWHGFDRPGSRSDHDFAGICGYADLIPAAIMAGFIIWSTQSNPANLAVASGRGKQWSVSQFVLNSPPRNAPRSPKPCVCWPRPRARSQAASATFLIRSRTIPTPSSSTSSTATPRPWPRTALPITSRSWPSAASTSECATAPSRT
jgi:adenylosuccinate synthase